MIYITNIIWFIISNLLKCFSLWWKNQIQITWGHSNMICIKSCLLHTLLFHVRYIDKKKICWSISVMLCRHFLLHFFLYECLKLCQINELHKRYKYIVNNLCLCFNHTLHCCCFVYIHLILPKLHNNLCRFLLRKWKYFHCFHCLFSYKWRSMETKLYVTNNTFNFLWLSICQ